MDSKARSPSVSSAGGDGQTPSKLKLDLSQIARHPLVKRMSPLQSSDSNNNMESSNGGTSEGPQVKQSQQLAQRQGASLLSAQFERLAQAPANPAEALYSTPRKQQSAASPSALSSHSRTFTPIKRSSFSSAPGPSSSSYYPANLRPTSLSTARLSASPIPASSGSSTAPVQQAAIKQIQCTPATPQKQQQQVNGTRDDDGSSMLRIRRSTSLSYTSTLRRRQAQSPLAPEPAELPSPKPNVVLPNFTISAYDSSTARKSLNLH